VGCDDFSSQDHAVIRGEEAIGTVGSGDLNGAIIRRKRSVYGVMIIILNRKQPNLQRSKAQPTSLTFADTERDGNLPNRKSIPEQGGSLLEDRGRKITRRPYVPVIAVGHAALCLTDGDAEKLYPLDASRCRRIEDGLNSNTRRGKKNFSPVFGLRPIRGPFWRTTKVPNEASFTVSPRSRQSVISFSTCSTSHVDSARVKGTLW
jgi:hypothetical protein